MADKRRFELFAAEVARRIQGRRIFDVAGGMGKLNEALTGLGFEVTTFDRRHKRLDVHYAQRDFGLDEPCLCDAVIGMHPDGATRIIIEYAAKHQIPCAVVPCCADNGMSYKPWVRHLVALAESLGLTVETVDLPMQGRAKVIWALPRSQAAAR